MTLLICTYSLFIGAVLRSIWSKRGDDTDHSPDPVENAICVITLDRPQISSLSSPHLDTMSWIFFIQ